MKPPALADALVNGFSVSPAVANEILGDLAEEWPERLDRDGPRRAARWYWGQARGAIPHLLRQWWLQSDWTAVIGVLAAAVLARMLLGFVGVGVTLALVHAGGEWQALYTDARWTLVVMVPVLVLAAGLTNFGIGALIAVVVRRAPMLVLAWTWVLIVVTDVSFYVLPPIGNAGFAISTWLFGKLVALPLMAAGALLVLRSRDRLRSTA